MASIRGEGVEAAPEEQRPATSRKVRIKRKKSAPAPSSESHPALLPAWEVDVIRFLCGGVIHAPHGCEVRQDGEGRQFVRAWPSKVPASAIKDVLRGREYGCALLLELDVTPQAGASERGECVVAIPASISRLRRVLARTQEERDLLVARVRAYPDVPADAVEFAVRGDMFAPPDEEEPTLDLNSAEQPRRLERFCGIDKTLGAIAGLVTGLRGGTWDSACLAKLSAAIAAPIEKAPALVETITTSLETEVGESLGPAFARHLAQHLTSTSPKEGFEPDALLEAVANEVRPAVAEKDAVKLDKFIATASAVIDGTSSAGRSLLADDGSIGLRAGLLVLRVLGDPEQLSGMCRGPNPVGWRVRALAWTLLGCFRGCAALPNALKSEPKELLLGLGDVAEMIRDGTAGAISGAGTRSAAGRNGWALSLAGREVLKLGVTGQEDAEKILALAERNAWVNEGDSNSLAYQIVVGNRAPIAFCFSTVTGAAFMPREPLIRVSAQASRPARALPGGKVMERLFDAGNLHKVDVQGVRVAAGWKLDFVAYLRVHDNKDDSVHQALSAVAAALDTSAEAQLAGTKSADSDAS